MLPSFEAFRERVGETFVLRVPEQPPIEVVLTSVRDLGPRPLGAPGERSFALDFRGPVERWARQGVYGIENHRLGSLELFLVPLGPEQGRMRYEAIFN
jgi:hypothetical protein